MHRKFIALIVSTAIAITGLGLAAQPARADETTRVLAGIAALALIGAAIRDAQRKDRVVTRQQTIYSGPTYQPPAPRNHVHAKRRPAYGQHVRRDLPNSCILPMPANRNGQVVVGEICLQRNAVNTAELPSNCRVSFWNGRKWRSGYDSTCLYNRGYRVAHR